MTTDTKTCEKPMGGSGASAKSDPGPTAEPADPADRRANRITRDDAVEIARDAALRHGGDHGYTPRSAETAALWQPHAWVVEAILAAASRAAVRSDPRIGRLCRPVQGSDRIWRVVAVEPGGMLRVREPHWTPDYHDFRIADDDNLFWFDDVAAARAIDGVPAGKQVGGARELVASPRAIGVSGPLAADEPAGEQTLTGGGR